MSLYEAAKDAARRARDRMFRGPLEFYHSYEKLGLALPQRGGLYVLNQQAKEPVLTQYLAQAIAECSNSRPITVCELFCADAYFSFLARRMGADHCDAFDSNRDDHFREARHVMKLLGETEVTLHKKNIFDFDSGYRASIVLNCGGLYHVSNPIEALQISARAAQRFLIVQSVVSLANESADYFEKPCPGWTWGCRFSHAWLEREISRLDFKIIASERNILGGNGRPEDRGSSYFLLAR